MEHASRRLLQCNVTSNPTAAWTLQQLCEAIASDHPPVRGLHSLSVAIQPNQGVFRFGTFITSDGTRGTIGSQVLGVLPVTLDTDELSEELSGRIVATAGVTGAVRKASSMRPNRNVALTAHRTTAKHLRQWKRSRCGIGKPSVVAAVQRTF